MVYRSSLAAVGNQARTDGPELDLLIFAKVFPAMPELWVQRQLYECLLEPVENSLGDIHSKLALDVGEDVSEPESCLRCQSVAGHYLLCVGRAPFRNDMRISSTTA